MFERMNYYESKQLQDRESRLIGACLALFIMAPIFGIVAGAFLASTTAMYLTAGSIALFAVFGIGGIIREKADRKNNISN